MTNVGTDRWQEGERPSLVPLALAPLFALAFAVLFLNKPWFDAMREWRSAIERDRRP